MQQFLLPPEARGQTARDDSRRAFDRVCTPERLTLASMLAITVPITTGFAFEVPLLLLPGTILTTYAFWRFSRRAKRGSMIVYCFAAGAIGGVLNAWFFLLLWGLVVLKDRLDLTVFIVTAPIGGLVGVAYAIVFLVPMLMQHSASSRRRTESIDRCLISDGAWGVLVTSAALAFSFTNGGPSYRRLEVVLGFALAGLGVHALMFSVGLVRWARRRWWLGRVVAGKVPGWQVCEQQRFQPAQLEGLEMFCQPLVGRAAPDGLRVLARNETSSTRDAYRSVTISPKFLIV